MDIIYLLLGVSFFGVSVALVRLFEKLGRG